MCCAAILLNGWALAGGAFFGATTTVLLILYVAKRAGASRTTVTLGGVAVNAILNALSEGITTLVPEMGMMTAGFRVGGFGSVSHLWLSLAALAILLALRNEPAVLSLGEETARSLGMETGKMRTCFLVLCACSAEAPSVWRGFWALWG